MVQTRKAFPLVADDEPVISATKEMAIYGNEDLITNIKGTYQDKFYVDTSHSASEQVWPEIEPPLSSAQEAQPLPRRQQVEQPIIEGQRGINNQPLSHRHSNQTPSLSRLARQEAKKDVKHKRQTYLTGETSQSRSNKAEQQMFSRVEARKKKDPTNSLRHLTDRLRQETYILAEVPKIYKEPNNKPVDQTKGNNFDFLKRSQVYNHKEQASQRERQIAQELNLSHF